MQRTITRGSFTIERSFDAPLPKVWNAFADPVAKKLWFKGPDGAPEEHSLDFRVGGTEHNEGTFHDGTIHSFEATYYDIVAEQRIVYAYEMYMDGKRISVSLATIEFTAAEGKTQLTLHEDGAFLDGFDKPEIREQGTRGLLNALATSLEEIQS